MIEDIVVDVHVNLSVKKIVEVADTVHNSSGFYFRVKSKRKIAPYFW